VPSIGSCSQFCLILQPHRVSLPFPPILASPWRISFVQSHGGITLLKAKFWTTLQKRPNNDLNWGVGSSYGASKPPLSNSSFPYEVTTSLKIHTVKSNSPFLGYVVCLIKCCATFRSFCMFVNGQQRQTSRLKLCPGSGSQVPSRKNLHVRGLWSKVD